MNVPVPDDPAVAAPWRVCHVNLARGFRGGERQTELLIRELAARDVAQRLVSRQGEPLCARLGDVPGLELRPGRGILAAARSIGKPDLIHVHEGRSLRSAWLNNLITGVPYLVTRRVLNVPRRHGLNRLMYRRAAAVTVLSDAVGQSLRQLDAAIGYRITPSAASGLCATRIDDLRDRWGGAFVVGHIGALDDADKGQLQIIEIARLLREFRPELRFVLVGGGEDETLLRDAASDLPGVVFEGHSERVADCLAAFDLFLFPSRREGLGSILIDAMSFGLPVVATRVGGIPELIEDGRNGRLLEAGDIGGLARAITDLIRDPDARARVGDANRERAGAYTAARMTERYLALYQELTGGPQVETA
ncbi:MAG: glycosyltransferase family 4 protein [Gammaproteobacteria bacterium]